MKLKLRKIGNSMGVLLPKDVITTPVGKYIGKLANTPVFVKKVFNTEPCSKHIGSMKGTCGC